MELPFGIAQFLIWITVMGVILLLFFVVIMLIIRVFKFKDLKDFLPISNKPSAKKFMTAVGNATAYSEAENSTNFKPAFIVRINDLRVFKLMAKLNIKYSREIPFNQASNIVVDMQDDMFCIALQEGEDSILYFPEGLEKADYNAFLTQASIDFGSTSLYGEIDGTMILAAIFHEGKEMEDKMNPTVIQKKLERALPSAIATDKSVTLFRWFDEE
mgnify:CR=1 FL=1